MAHEQVKDAGAAVADLALTALTAPIISTGVGTLSVAGTDTNLSTFTTAVQSRINDMEAKINDLLAKLRTAGVIDA